MNRPEKHNIIKIISALGIIALAALCIYAWRAGLFASQERLQDYISSLGWAGPLIFMALQVAQVVIAVLPAAVGYLAGVVLFGPLMGFIYSYIGICAGSILAFVIGRKFGRKLIQHLFSPEQIARYDTWTQGHKRFIKLFALVIFLPIAPDDLLCYLAGTTKMRFSVFLIIILLGKPLSIVFYSLGLGTVLNYIPGWIAN